MNKIDWKTLFFVTGTVYFVLAITQMLLNWILFYFRGPF